MCNNFATSGVGYALQQAPTKKKRALKDKLDSQARQELNKWGISNTLHYRKLSKDDKTVEVNGITFIAKRKKGKAGKRSASMSDLEAFTERQLRVGKRVSTTKSNRISKAEMQELDNKELQARKGLTYDKNLQAWIKK